MTCPYQTLYDRLSKADVVVLDTETNGLDWRKNHVVGLVVTLSPRPQDSTYYPMRHAGGGNRFDPVRVFDVVRSSLRRRGVRKVFHNAGFDLAMLAVEGVEFRHDVEDTMVNEGLLNENARSFSLEATAARRGVTAKKGEAMYRYLADRFGGEAVPDQMANYHKLPGDDPMAVEYATGDGTTTWEVWEKQQAMLDEQELRRVWDIECRCIPLLHRMMWVGTKVDEERMEQVGRILTTAAEKAKESLPADFNERSPKQIMQVLKDGGVTEGWPVTAKGNPSFVKDWLLTNEPGRRIVALREFTNTYNSFWLPLKEKHLHKGRVHSVYVQSRSDDGGTVTGRLACHDPNRQAAPKRNKTIGPLIRSMFIPDEGHAWRSADLSQCEPRLLAHYSGAKALVEGYLSTPFVDAHQSVADVTGMDRESGKRINQALITGAGERKTAEMIGRPMAEAREMRATYFARLPEIPTIQRRMIDRMRSRGYILTMLDRRCRLDDPNFAYKALNRALQGSNADIIKAAMVHIDEELGDVPGFMMLDNVHDAIDFQWTPDNRKAVDRAIEIMEDFGPGRRYELRVPMVAEFDDGKDWGEATWGTETMAKAFAKFGEEY